MPPQTRRHTPFRLPKLASSRGRGPDQRRIRAAASLGRHLRSLGPHSDHSELSRFAAAVGRAEDRRVVALLTSLHKYSPAQQRFTVACVFRRIRKDRRAGIRWSPVHDAFGYLPQRLVDALGWAMQVELVDDQVAMQRWAARAAPHTVAKAFRFRALPLRLDLANGLVRNSRGTPATWRRVEQFWPKARTMNPFREEPRGRALRTRGIGVVRISAAV